MTEQNTQVASESTEIVKNLFGDHPEDVIGPIQSAAEALSWLEEIFRTIVAEVRIDSPSGYRIKRLAEAGAYLALDMGDYVSHSHETYLDRLKDAGVIGDSQRGEA